MIVYDYNGTGRWSADAIRETYEHLASSLGIERPLIFPRREYVEERKQILRIYPVMDDVIAGIDVDDAACVAIGVAFIEEDAKFPFGKTLKCRAARALRRATLSDVQRARIRRRVFGLLRDGHIPHEFRDYARLVRTIGFTRREFHETCGWKPPGGRYTSYFWHGFDRVAR